MFKLLISVYGAGTQTKKNLIEELWKYHFGTRRRRDNFEASFYICNDFILFLKLDCNRINFVTTAKSLELKILE